MVDLKKSADTFRVSLAKKGVTKMPDLEVATALDVSGSFRDEHEDGLTNVFLTRIVPWGMTFDPDKKIDVFTFSDGVKNAYYVGAIEPGNYQDFVRKNIIDIVPGWRGGTDYAPVLKLILAHFGWIKLPSPVTPSKQGFFGWLFGKKPTADAPVVPKRSIVFFVTDGANDDPDAATAVIADAEKNGYETFFVFVGISNQKVSFTLLKNLAARHGNAIFRNIEDIAAFNDLSDEALNDFFLDDKLTAWLSH